MMWTRRFVSVLLAMILALGLVSTPRQAAAIDDRWWFLYEPPPSDAGDPDGPPPVQEILASTSVTIWSFSLRLGDLVPLLGRANTKAVDARLHRAR